MPRGGRIDALFEGEEGLREAFLQADCFVEWHSNLSMSEAGLHRAGTSETVAFFKSAYPGLHFQYNASSICRTYSYVIPLLLKLLSSLREDPTRCASLDGRLSSVLAGLPIGTRELVLGRFVNYLEREQASTTFRGVPRPSRVSWPEPLERVRDLARAEAKA
jgi:hypothetical protein